MRVSEAMTPTHYDVHPDHPLRDALVRMREDAVAVLPVVDGDEVVGLLTLAEARGETTVWDVDPEKAAVRDVMTADFTWCYADEDIDRAKSLLEQSGQRCMPVVNRDHELVGMISAGGGKSSEGTTGTSRQASTGGRAIGGATGSVGGDHGYTVRPRVRART